MAEPPSPSQIGDLERIANVLIPGQHLGTGILTVSLGVAIGLLGLWWLREHRLARDRRAMRQIHRLGEQIAADRSGEEILKRLRAVLPEALRVTGIHLYLYSRASRTLNEVSEDSPARSRAIPLEQANGSLESALVTCFRNRSLLMIPDLRRSLLNTSSQPERLPRSAMLVPMFAQADIVGILAFSHSRRPRSFSLDERAIVQHLANQIAINLRLREQQTGQERVVRNENLAATSQLISTVATELHAPIKEIENSGDALLRGNGEIEPEVRSIIAGARQAEGIVNRLLSIMRSERRDPAPVEIAALLREVAGERAHSLEQRQVKIQFDLLPEGLSAEGRRDQLREVILSLLTYAEGKAAASAEKRISIRAGTLAGTVGIEIGFSGEGASPDPFSESGESLAGILRPVVCRGILHNQGGDLRHLNTPDRRQRFDIILPAVRPTEGLGKESVTQEDEDRILTALVADPDATTRRQLTSLLADTGHRCVPVASGEEVVDLSRRLSFDVVFSPARLPGMNCFELFEKLRERVPAFVLLAEGPDSELLNSLPEETVHVLHKPVDKEEFHQLLAAIESHPPASAR